MKRIYKFLIALAAIIVGGIALSIPAALPFVGMMYTDYRVAKIAPVIVYDIHLHVDEYNAQLIEERFGERVKISESYFTFEGSDRIWYNKDTEFFYAGKTEYPHGGMYRLRYVDMETMETADLLISPKWVEPVE